MVNIIGMGGQDGSDYTMNSYLKEIADNCAIQKELTFHAARHTFATTITLNNHVPIESVSKMLGHKWITSTMHYAKLQDRTVSQDMRHLYLKFKVGKVKSLNIS